MKEMLKTKLLFFVFLISLSATAIVYAQDDGSECTDGAPYCSCENSRCLCTHMRIGNGTACEDIDECAEPDRFCNSTTSLCRNHDFGFDCVCKSGFIETAPAKGFIPDENVHWKDWDYVKNECTDITECVAVIWRRIREDKALLKQLGIW